MCQFFDYPTGEKHSSNNVSLSSSVKRKHHDINVDDRVHPAKRAKSEYVSVSQEDKSSDLLDLMSSIEENPDDSYNMLLEFINKNYQ